MALMRLRRNGLPQPLARLAGSDPQRHMRPAFRVLRHRAIPIQESLAFLSTNEPSVHLVPGSWKWDPLGPGRAESSIRGEAELLFFDPTGHGRARDAKRTREATQAAAFLVGVHNLLTAGLRIGMGSRVLATLPSARVAARELFARVFACPLRTRASCLEVEGSLR
jgi:hypothetical protein